MNSIKEIAQWVIDNRYPKTENNKISDHEMYHVLVESMEKLLIKTDSQKDKCDHDPIERGNCYVCSKCGKIM